MRKKQKKESYICSTCGWTGEPVTGDRWLKLAVIPAAVFAALILPAVVKMVRVQDEIRARANQNVSDYSGLTMHIANKATSPEAAAAANADARAYRDEKNAEIAQRIKTAKIAWSVLILLLMAGAAGSVFIGFKKSKADLQCAECRERKLFVVSSAAGKRLAASFGKPAA